MNPLKTAVHELGHVVLGHTANDAHADYLLHRGVSEFQAEATAYLTLHELDVMDEVTASRSRAYVQGWLQGETTPDLTMSALIGQVFAAHDEILRAGFEESTAVAA